MNVMKKLGFSMATMALGATLLAGGSFALFTSSATNTGNTFTAGTVILTSTTEGSVVSQEVNFENLAPGDAKKLQMTVKNDGTLDEWVRINTVESEATKTGDLFKGSTPLTLTYDTDVVELAPGESVTFDIDYLFPLAANNDYQGDTGSFNVVVQSVQSRNNTNADSSGPNTWN